ncbi:MAG TPA: PEP-CTERM sorting domain-containing protein [Candidatus Acidoferrales bacterium]|nr:PEP-CTERM sorting domain-containing protein [Candidatus Acidoferrales bacterium]
MKARFVTAMGILIFGATSAFAGPTNFNFGFGGSDQTLGTSASYTSNGATVTAFGYECTASDSTSTATLSACAGSALFQKNDGGAEFGLGLAGETDHEIGYDGANADYVMGLDLSNLLSLGARSITLTFGSVQPGEAFAALGYGSNPFGASSFALTNTQAWCGFQTAGCTYNGDVVSATFSLNSQDDFLVLMSPCGASSVTTTGNCGSNVTLGSLSGTSATPEPGTIALFATGFLMLGFATRKRWATQRN